MEIAIREPGIGEILLTEPQDGNTGILCHAEFEPPISFRFEGHPMDLVTSLRDLADTKRSPVSIYAFDGSSVEFEAVSASSIGDIETASAALGTMAERLAKVTGPLMEERIREVRFPVRLLAGDGESGPFVALAVDMPDGRFEIGYVSDFKGEVHTADPGEGRTALTYWDVLMNDPLAAAVYFIMDVDEIFDRNARDFFDSDGYVHDPVEFALMDECLQKHAVRLVREFKPTLQEPQEKAERAQPDKRFESAFGECGQ